VIWPAYASPKTLAKSNTYCYVVQLCYISIMDRNQRTPIRLDRCMRGLDPVISSGSVSIPLTRGMSAIVDIGRYHMVCDSLWSARWSPITQSYYAVRSSRKTTILMHRVICEAPRGRSVDHRNHDTLDNREENLRIATPSQSQMNRCGWGAVSMKGVRRRPNGRFDARIQANGLTVHLGTFPSAEDAARAYDNEARRLHGPFALTNGLEDKCN